MMLFYAEMMSSVSGENGPVVGRHVSLSNPYLGYELGGEVKLIVDLLIRGCVVIYRWNRLNT